jgi:hypothetical protein
MYPMLRNVPLREVKKASQIDANPELDLGQDFFRCQG